MHVPVVRLQLASFVDLFEVSPTLEMPDPTRHPSHEIASAVALTAAAVGAALLGALLGLVAGRRRGDRTPYAGPARATERVVWARLSELEAQVQQRDHVIDTLRRDYDLDTGLLKQEIQRLELLLGRFSSGRLEPHRLPTAQDVEAPETRRADGPKYHPLKLIESSSAGPAETIPFLPIARYAEEKTAD